MSDKKTEKYSKNYADFEYPLSEEVLSDVENWNCDLFSAIYSHLETLSRDQYFFTDEFGRVSVAMGMFSGDEFEGETRFKLVLNAFLGSAFEAGQESLRNVVGISDIGLFKACAGEIEDGRAPSPAEWEKIKSDVLYWRRKMGIE